MNPSSIRVLGIDPGFDRLGMGVIDSVRGEPSWIHHACVQTSARDDFSLRLQQIRDGIQTCIRTFSPTHAVVEDVFFQSNAKTALKVGMARGVVLLAIADCHVPVLSIGPGQVKEGIAGWGGADKKQVQLMVQRLLKLKDLPTPDDAADALAIAIVGGMLWIPKLLASS